MNVVQMCVGIIVCVALQVLLLHMKSGPGRIAVFAAFMLAFGVPVLALPLRPDTPLLNFGMTVMTMVVILAVTWVTLLLLPAASRGLEQRLVRWKWLRPAGQPDPKVQEAEVEIRLYRERKRKPPPL